MSSNRAKVYIDGHVGTTGLRIRDWLRGRDDLEVLDLPEATARIRRRAARGWTRPTWPCSACRTTRRAKRRDGQRRAGPG